MAFAVIPFCWIVKFSGITRFLYQFLKISPKYCGRKEKDHNILWSKWYSRRESNPQRPLRRGLLYPFNYGSVLRCKFPPPGGYQPKPLKGPPRLSVASLARTTGRLRAAKTKRTGTIKGACSFGTPGGNRTHNGPLGVAHIL